MSAGLKATIAAIATVSLFPSSSRAVDRLVGTTCKELYDNCVEICKRQRCLEGTPILLTRQEPL